MGGRGLDFKIIEWTSKYSSDIREADSQQQKCFQNIKNEILKGRYVDVGENDAYLFAYGCWLYDLLLDNKGQISVSSANSISTKTLENISQIKNFIIIYEETKPHVVKYSYPVLIFADIYYALPHNQLEKDFLAFLNFCDRNSFCKYGELLALLYRYIYDVGPDTEIKQYRFLPLFAKFSFKQYLTAVGIGGYEEILCNIEKIAQKDYESNKVNFLYRLYDFVDGSLCGFSSGHYVSFLTSEFLNSEWNNSGVTERYLREESVSFIDHFLVPDDNKEKVIIYLETILREAENQYRIERGLPRVGDGWISETLLFRQIEAAFPQEEVEQHAHPCFLGKQHYDVYIPKYKIAVEYQGDQHFKPIDFFGGEKTFKKNQERDSRKKEISKKNGITLIEVLPDYQLCDVIYKILSCLEDRNGALFSKHLQEAVERANIIQLVNSDYSNMDSGNLVKKRLERTRKRSEQKKESDDKLDSKIAELVLKHTPSAHADNPPWQRSHEAFQLGATEFNRAESIRKEDPEEAFSIYMNLIEKGIYNAPVVYERAAQFLRKQKRLEEEIELLLQMKRDYGYRNYDSRLRTLLRNTQL